MPKPRGIDYLWDIYRETLAGKGVPAMMIEAVFPSFISGAMAAVCLVEEHNSLRFNDFLRNQLEAHMASFGKKTEEDSHAPVN